ncbi:MAG: o-succinylbenzoate--CoA ligase [Ktedonobacterales bacterium]|nr:o-succinylbenzoate--CoA ligase [Ktedonobacterales bacterium]
MTTLPNWLHRAAANFPDKLAVRCGTTDWTFAELDQQATALAASLAARGIRAGERVALLASNGLPFVASVHALTRLGGVLVPLNIRLTDDDLRWQLADVKAAHLLHEAHFADRAANIAHLSEENTLPMHPVILAADIQTPSIGGKKAASWDDIDLDAPQAIIYTSGTTGQPKGAIITYGMQWWNAVGSALNLGHDPADRWLAVLPFFHIGGLSILWRSVIYGIGVVVHQRFDAASVNQSIQEDSVTIASVVSVMVQRMLDDLGESVYPQSLRCLLLGGGPAPETLLRACAARGIPVVQTYGMTETCSQAVTLAPVDALRKLGSAGRPLASVELRVWNDDHEADPDEAGEIQLRGPTITPGYAERPDATARAWQAGWFATGDIGTLDPEGFLYVLDRRSDLIISGGENVYPAEIEAALLAHPDVLEAGVTGVADAQWGQAPIAFVHLREGATADADTLHTFLATRLAHYKQPRTIYLTGPLPRNAAGKLLRRELGKLVEPPPA